MNLFCKHLNEIKSNFINFALLTPLIDGCNIINYLDVIFEIFDDEWGNEYLCISQILDNNENIRFATFYNYYNYTIGLKQLIKNKDLHKHFRIKVDFENVKEKVKLYINIYIDKLFLLDIYENKISVPELIYQIIIDKSLSHLNSQKVFHNNLNDTSSFSKELNMKSYKRNLFDHQKRNINWMIDVERKIRNNCLFFNYYDMDTENTAKYHLKSIDENLYLDTKNRNILDTKRMCTKTLNVIGGMLCDEVGLGKTSSMIGLIKSDSCAKNTTLVVCPRRICKQWLEEIDKTTSLNSLIIYSIKQIKLLNKKKIKEYDVVIVPYSVFVNKKYLDLVSNQKKFSIENFLWHRVILDESHEYICSSNKNNIINIRNKLNVLVSNYRWMCSATPNSNNLYYLMEGVVHV